VADPGQRLTDRFGGGSDPADRSLIPGRAARALPGGLRYLLYTLSGVPTTEVGDPDVGATVDALDLPDGTSGASLLELAELIGDRRGSVSDLLALPPVLPSADGALRQSEFETDLARRLPHVQQVCHHPYERLDRIEEVTEVSRARRVSDRALERLASRTEDWQSRRADRVIPKRVFNDRVESVADIFENRVAGKLVDLTLEYIRARRKDVQRILSFLEDLRRIQDSMTGRSWRVAHRGWEQFAAVAELNDQVQRGAGLLSDLRELEMRLRALQGSSLYQSVDHRKPIPSPLPMTNLLVNDQHYRHVSALWAALWQLDRLSELSPAEAAIRFGEICDAMEAFTLLLVLRALDHLGLAVGEYPQRGGPPVRVEGRDREVTLEWTSCGELRLDLGEAIALRLLPVASPLSTLASRSEAIEAVIAGARPDPITLVYLSPGRIDLDDSDLEPRSWLLDRWSVQLRADGFNPSGGLVPVSPLDVDSTERMIRTVRWSLLRADLQAYPARVRAGRDALQILRSAGSMHFEVTSVANELGVVGFPTEDEVEAICRSARQAVGALPVNLRRDVLVELASSATTLREGVRATAPLFRCPTCGEARKVRISSRGRSGFWCSCDSCDTEWGSAQCGNCGSRFPVLQPPLQHPSMRTDVVWIDRTYGGDVTSEPCWATPTSSRFVCPACDACAAPDQDKQECARCKHAEQRTSASISATDARQRR